MAILRKHRDVQYPNLRGIPENVKPAHRFSVIENQLIAGVGKLRPIVRILGVKLKSQECFPLFVAPRDHREFVRARAGIDFSEERFVFARNITQANRHSRSASILLNQTIEYGFIVSAFPVAADWHDEQLEVSHLIVFERPLALPKKHLVRSAKYD